MCIRDSLTFSCTGLDANKLLFSLKTSFACPVLKVTFHLHFPWIEMKVTNSLTWVILSPSSLTRVVCFPSQVNVLLLVLIYLFPCYIKFCFVFFLRILYSVFPSLSATYTFTWAIVHNKSKCFFVSSRTLSFHSLPLFYFSSSVYLNIRFGNRSSLILITWTTTSAPLLSIRATVVYHALITFLKVYILSLIHI